MSIDELTERASAAIDKISEAFAANPSERTMRSEVRKHLTGDPAVDVIIVDWSERTLTAWLAKKRA